MNNIDYSESSNSKFIIEAAIRTTLEPFDDLSMETFQDIDSDSFVVCITRKNHVLFPKPLVKSREREESLNTRVEHSHMNMIPNPIRIIISSYTLKASLQVFGKEVDSVSPVIEFVKLNSVNESCSVQSRKENENCYSVSESLGGIKQEAEDYQLLPVPINNIKKEPESGDHDFGNEITDAGIWTVSSDFVMNLLRKLTSYGGYRLCRGYTYEDFKFDVQSTRLPHRLVKRNVPCEQFESPRCTAFLTPKQNSNSTLCRGCLSWLCHYKMGVRKKWGKQDQIKPGEKSKRSRNNLDSEENSSDATEEDLELCFSNDTAVNSRTTFAALSPTAQKIRLRNFSIERRQDKAKIAHLEGKLKKLTAQMKKI